MDLRFSCLLSVVLVSNLFIHCSLAGRGWGDGEDDGDDRRRGGMDGGRRGPGGRQGPPEDEIDDEGEDDRMPLKMLNGIRGKEGHSKRRGGGRNADSSSKERDGWDGARGKTGGGRRMGSRNGPRDDGGDDGRRGREGGRRYKGRSWSTRGRGGPEDDTGSGEGKRKGRGRYGPKGKGKGNFGKSNRNPFLNRGTPVQWKPWEESECLWVDQVKGIPESCHLKNLAETLPPPVAKYYTSKAFETYESVRRIFKERGLTDKCGHCSRKVACRQAASSSNKYFLPIEFAFVNEDCDNGDPCEVSAVDGACPAPLPQKYFVMYNLLSSAKRALSRKSASNLASGPVAFQFNERRPFKLGGSSGDDDGTEGEDDDNGNFENDWARDDQWPYGGQTVDETVVDGTDGGIGDGGMDGNQTDVTNGPSAPTGNISTILVPIVVVEVQRPSPRFEGGKSYPPQEIARKRYTYDIPLWHCVKNPVAEDKCLCCCGDFYPDAVLGTCVPVKHGNRYPPMDIDLEP